MKKYNWCAFFLVIFLYIIIPLSIYSNVYNKWIIAPPTPVIFIFSIVGLILAILGFRDKSSWFAKLRSWFSTILSSILIFILIVVMLFTTLFSGSKELLTTVQSPDGKYTINFYISDAGGMGTFGVLGELRGPLWFKKKIYVEKRVDQVNIEWENSHTALINNHKLDLTTGEVLIVE